MKNKLLGLIIILAMIILMPSCILASGYSGIDTELQIGNTAAAQSSVGMTERIVGTLQVAGTIIAVISLIIIGMRYMLSSVEERAKVKGVIGYWIIGAMLVLCTSNVLAFVYDIIDDIQHTYVDIRVIEPPTCVKTGILLRECKDCGKQIEVDIPINPDAHKMSDWTCTAETCTTDGKKVRTCTYGCGKRDEETIPKLGHNFEFGVIKSPTCTQEGYQGNKCKRCGVEKDTSVLVATGHSYVIKDTTSTYLKSPATCTAKAVYYYKCSGGCGGKGSSTYEHGNLLAHSYTITNDTSVANRATKATCTTQATYYKKCSCGATHASYTFASGSTLAHSYTITNDTSVANRATKATCTAQATYYRKCSCGATNASYTFASGNLADHVFAEENTSATYLASNATCTAKAKYYYKCSYCSAKNTETFEAGELVSHNWITPQQDDKVLASSATCQSGPRYYYECSYGCGTHDNNKTFEFGQKGSHNMVIPGNWNNPHWFIEHSDEYKIYNANCGNAALYWKECSYCGYTYRDFYGPLVYDESITFRYGSPTR